MNLKYLVLDLKYIFILNCKFYISHSPLDSTPKNIRKLIFDIFMKSKLESLKRLEKDKLPQN